MNLNSIVVVAIRLFALDFLMRAVAELSPKVFQLLKLYRASPADHSRVETAFPWLLILGLLVFAVLLWVSALPVARLVTRRLPQEVSVGAITLGDCYSIMFIGFGLYYIAGSLPQVLTWCHFLFKTAATTWGDSWKEQLTYEVTGIFIRFTVGLVLLVNGRAWALALARSHTDSRSVNPGLQPSAVADGSPQNPKSSDGGSPG